MIKSITIVLLTILSFSISKINAQDTHIQNVRKTNFSIETDPSAFVFSGFAFHFRIKPKNNRHFLIGAGTYGMDMPEFMVDMNAENKNKGWNVRIQSAYSFFGEYYFKDANTKWFVGLQAGVQNYKNTLDNIPNEGSKYSNLLVMPSVGYTWRPFSIPLYLKPWFGLGYTTKIAGDNAIDGFTYKISPIAPFMTLHVGYVFGE